MEDQDAARLAQENDTQQPEIAAAEPEVTEEDAVVDAEAIIAAEAAAEHGTPGEPVEEQEEDTSALRATLEAIVYITDEPLTAQQMSAAIGQPIDKIKRLLDELVAEYEKPQHGLSIREVAGGYKMATKAEHHEAVRAFVKKLTPPLKLSLAALETLAVIAYKQPVTAPEIMDIRGVQGAGVLKTLLDRKLIQEGGRKKVIGQPILYKTTKEFLVQFGLNGLSELPTLKEFEELGRLELVEEAEAEIDAAEQSPETSELAPVESESGESTEPEESKDESQPEETAEAAPEEKTAENA
jgi:segregation and condensation protein B